MTSETHPGTDAEYVVITTTEELVSYVEQLGRCPVIAVDTESNSLHRYRERVSLIQLTGREADGTAHHAIVDPLVDVDISLLGPLMADPDVVTIFHGADFDVVSLKRDYGFTFANIYDTMIAARASGVARFGLADLVQQNYGVTLNKKYQKHDWTERPLSQEALDYAHMDTVFLPDVMDRLKVQVRDSGREDMVAEECALVAERSWTPPPPATERFIQIKGAARLPKPTQRILRALVAFRDIIAEQRDRPTFKVFGNDLLIAIANAEPADAAALEAVAGKRNRQVRRYGPSLLAAVADGQVDDTPLPTTKGNGVRRASREDEALFNHLRLWRNKRAEKEGVEPSLVLNNLVLTEISAARPTTEDAVSAVNSIRRWQVVRYAAPVAEQVAVFTSNDGAPTPPPSAPEPEKN